MECISSSSFSRQAGVWELCGISGPAEGFAWCLNSYSNSTMYSGSTSALSNM